MNGPTLTVLPNKVVELLNSKMTGADLAKLGKCGHCKEGVLQHGPWTDEQIAEAVVDTGEPDFSDWCDSCFTRLCCGGDVREASKQLGRPVTIGFTALLGTA